MVTFKTTPIDVRTLNGFFEASWLFKRNGTYYMAYAANTAGPTSECTEAVYYACIAYGTSPSPLGPWTYRGVILDPVSSTTSHPGIIEYKGKWYLVYHTADARNGGHFRRSVAIDRLEWDDAVVPPRIKKVVPTGGAPVDTTPIANIASHARISASNVPVPTQYWLRAVNDGKVRTVAASAGHVGHVVAQQPAATMDHVSVGAAGDAHRNEPSFLGRSRRGSTPVLFFHGSPKSYDDWIFATTPDEELRPMLDNVQQRVLVGGHTHVQMIRRYLETVIINPGSVGLPFREWWPRPIRISPWAEWGIIEGEDGRLSLDLRRTPFDVDAFLQMSLSSGMPHAEWWAKSWSRDLERRTE